ncbi:LytTR family DNA-binding domain-containing protein [Winogradskyella sp.]|uniref:LytR/AlgR family response regulator transcription factor n=1 Tax=Winogradskyella sp. TaxID=1883156 RepID=UPI002604652F|nr:LytTR family DNA-binding domain-containing protein [Winogradskyella sp.]
MIRTFILDDDQKSIDRILYHLAPYNNKFTVVATCNTIEDALSIVEENEIDLAFLDVEIHDKTSFDFLNQLNSIDFGIIFVTGFNKYAIEAFNYAAIHYLLKPILGEKFKEAITRFLDKSIEKTQRQKQIEVLTDRWNNKPKKTITIPSDDKGLQFPKISDIIYIEANGSYSKVFAKKGKKYLPSKNLKYYEEHLKGTSIIRIHKSFMVNTDYVTNYIHGQGGSVFLNRSVTQNILNSLPVSRERKQELLQFLQNR